MVSRRLGDWLDKEDFIDESYILAVSYTHLDVYKRQCLEVSGGMQKIKEEDTMEKTADFTEARRNLQNLQDPDRRGPGQPERGPRGNRGAASLNLLFLENSTIQ